MTVWSGFIGSAAIFYVNDSPPYFARESFKRRNELTVGMGRLLIRMLASNLRGMRQIDAEHPVIGGQTVGHLVAPRAT